MVNPIKPLVTQETRLHDLQLEREKEFINELKPVSVESGADLAGFGPGNLQANTGQATGGSFLSISGGVMSGPIGFNPVLVEIVGNTVDLARTTGLFTGRLILNGEGGDIADIIEKFVGGNNDFPGRMISIQGTVGETITFKHRFNGGGNGDIRTPGGVDFILTGFANITLIYDAVQDEWAFMDEGLVSVGANKTLSNLISPTSIPVALLPNASGTLDIGSAALAWDALNAGRVNFRTDLVDPTGASPHLIQSGSQGIVQNVELITDTYRFFFNGINRGSIRESGGQGLADFDILEANAFIQMQPNAGDPAIDGVLKHVTGGDVKVKSGGLVRNFSDIVVGGGANKTLSNLDTPTAINRALIPSGLLDIGSSANPWDRINLGGVQFRTDLSAPLTGTPHRISASSAGMDLNVELAIDSYRFYFNGSLRGSIRESSGQGLVDFDILECNSHIVMQPSTGDPALDGIMKSISGNVKVKSGGSVRNFSQMAEKNVINVFSVDQQFDEDVILGSSSIDNITFNGETVNTIKPNVDDTDDIGSSGSRYRSVFVHDTIDLLEGFADGFAPTGQTDRAILFSRPSAGGKTEFRVKFQTGTSVLIAIEP